MTPAEIAAYYSALLILQYADKSRAKATVEAFAAQFIADNILSAIGDGFDLETASGKILDILGEYRGVKRAVFGLDLTRRYFEMATYDETNGALVDTDGFARYADEAVEGFFLRYRDINKVTYELTDDEMRRLIKLRAQFHRSTLGLGEIDAILFAFFGDEVHLEDNLDMTIEYEGDPGSLDTLFKIAKETSSFPKPAGVSVTITP